MCRSKSEVVQELQVENKYFEQVSFSLLQTHVSSFRLHLRCFRKPHVLLHGVGNTWAHEFAPARNSDYIGRLSLIITPEFRTLVSVETQDTNDDWQSVVVAIVENQPSWPLDLVIHISHISHISHTLETEALVGPANYAPGCPEHSQKGHATTPLAQVILLLLIVSRLR